MGGFGAPARVPDGGHYEIYNIQVRATALELGTRPTNETDPSTDFLFKIPEATHPAPPTQMHFGAWGGLQRNDVSPDEGVGNPAQSLGASVSCIWNCMSVVGDTTDLRIPY